MTIRPRRVRRTIVLAGVSLALSGSVAFAPSALAQPGQVATGPGIVYGLPECFGRAYQTVSYINGNQALIGSPGVIYADYGGSTYGTSGDDVIIGSPVGDTIYGMGGDDKICSGGGDDRVYGEQGGDQVDGGSGADLIKGGEGGDMLYGQDNRDEIWGDDANGLGTNDYIFGGGAVDTIYCTDGGLDYADGGQGVDLPVSAHGCETYDNH